VSVVSNSPVGSVRFGQDLEVLPTLDAPSARCRVGRDGLGDVYSSAVLAGRQRFPGARTVVIAGSAAPLDGLVAAPLANAKGAPLLLTSPRSLPPVVADEITARGVSTAYVVGGTSSVSAAVEARLRALGVTSVIRLSGRDRYAVAASVARQVGAAGRSAVVVSGSSVADAAAVAGPAAASGRPVLLVARTGVPAATSSALKALRVHRVLVVGSTTAVPAKVAAMLRASGVTEQSRVGSADPSGTAAAVATAFRRPVGVQRVVVAPSGSALWSVVAAAQGRLTLVTDRAGVPAATAAWLRANRPAAVGLVADWRTVGTPVMRALQVAIA
jgi:putative cell wall-binding protein